MLHPDYQYAPKLVPAMAAMVVSGEYDVVLGSRILGGKARKSGMPVYKYISNRFLTLTENLFFGSKLSEFHTGYRAFLGVLGSPVPREFGRLLITRCWLVIFFNFNVEIPAPHGIFRRHPPSISGDPLFTGFGVLWTSVASRPKNGAVYFRIFEISSAVPAKDYYSEIK
jgi:hypothetical protein